MRAEHYDAHHALEETHWWFTARRSIVLRLLERELRLDAALRPPLRLLDIGCGTGGMLPHLGKYGSVVGVDPAPEAIAYASERDFDVRRGGLPADLPFGPGETFDIITLLDVLEHVEADRDALTQIRARMSARGRLLVTVPAFQFLWSGHDVINEHKRRYRRTGLRSRLEQTGFKVRLLSYCNFALFLPIAAIRLLRRQMSVDERQTYLGTVPAPLNGLLHTLFASERYIIPALPLPFGVSLIAVASASED